MKDHISPVKWKEISSADIDIDFADRTVLLDKLQHRVAKLPTGKKHNTGVYATEIFTTLLINFQLLITKQQKIEDTLN